MPCTTLVLKNLTSKKGFISCDFLSLSFPGPRTVNLVNTDLYGLLRLWYSVIGTDGWWRQVGDLKGKYFVISKEIVIQDKWDNRAVVNPGSLDGRAWGNHLWMILLGQSRVWVVGIIHGWETYRTWTLGTEIHRFPDVVRGFIWTKHIPCLVFLALPPGAHFATHSLLCLGNEADVFWSCHRKLFK